ncbi:hypothetical protein [Tellurirhabdus bombi]|uniref:hypothetical protein n=1 Tax=Tellurirhabdus bombi TaxID=2907205 RepID=UPI001F181F45|nr:hypothetical protein [Tellurirhabdus bombi]
MQVIPGTQLEETWRKSIPAQVFLNHFFAIDFHIQRQDDLFDLARFPLFQSFEPTTTEEQRKALEKLLLNCWSAEYALRITPVVNDNQYLQNSLHWTFPQAYYSVLFGVRAFLLLAGESISNEETIRRRVGNMVVRGYYPSSTGFYASGPLNNYRTMRLPLAKSKPDLTLPSRESAAQAEVAQFLKTTRDQRIKALRQIIQKNPKTAFRSARTGEILQKFSEEQYKQLGKQLGYTTYFDILSRLRISSTNREIERFVDSEIDVRLFHESLVNIVSHLNAVHEAYIAKALGIAGFKRLIAKLPIYLQEGFLRDRLTNIIEPLLLDSQQEHRLAA